MFLLSMYHSFFIHSSFDEHLGCFHVLAIINSAAMNIGVHERLSLLHCIFLPPLSKIRCPFTIFFEVAQSCPTLCDPMDCSLPSSSVHGILQARVLEWGAISFPRGSSWPRDWTQVSCIPSRFFTIWATRESGGSYCKMVHNVALQMKGKG